MDGRMGPAAGFLVMAALTTACQPWGPFAVIGALGDVASETPSTAPSVERPPLRRILADGRFEFTEGPGSLERRLERRMRQDPQARAELDKLVLRTATDRRTGWQLYVVANVLSDRVAVQDETWDGFLRGLSGQGVVDVEEGRMLGAESAWIDAPGQSSLSIRYSDDLFITVLAPASTPRVHLEDLARQLLRTR